MSRPKPPPGFTLDDEDEAPAPPPGFTLDATPSLGMDSIVAPRDGDTFRLDGGRNLRLWGVDAPELKQQGWDRQGNPVPIGRQSLDAVSRLLSGASPVVGKPVGQSYGRMVAPVTLGDTDLGQTLTRNGSALAAPEYLARDPQRRFDTMQAERLARLNGLGIHDTMFQPPAEYRKAPYTPDREDVAMFWDTPTPMAGLRAETEKAYLDLSRTGTADELLAFAKANGFSIDADEARRFVADRDKGASVDYRAVYNEALRPLTDPGDGAQGAAVRGFGRGVLAEGLDEAGAFIDMAGLTSGRESVWNSDRRLADIWSNNQQQNSAILGFDDSAHPYATLGGQVAGGLAVPFGARARSAAQLFRVGAGYGGAAGFLGTDGTIGERAIGGAIGVPVGGVLGAVGGKALEGVLKAAPRLAGYVRGKPANAPEASPAGQYGADLPPMLDDITDGRIPDPPEGFTRDAMPMEAPPMPSLRSRDVIDVSRPTRMDQPLTDAQRQAMAQGIDPGDVLPRLSNEIADVEEAAARDAGRFELLRPPNERDVLSSNSYIGNNGREVPKRGPVDLIGWARLNGGLNDSGDSITRGGDLKAMGFTNARRSGMDHVGLEDRFGPLVNDNGMNLDDAALRAWEEGYFPDHAERPSVNEFLDALRDTYEGHSRRFRADDMAEVERFDATRQERLDLERQLANGPVHADRSMPAEEPQPFAPPEAYEEWPAGGPDFAGNINLGKLESPQDIARALDMTQRRVGFDAATRGRVSQAETERLAADLNMTPDSLIARRQGAAFNAEEALAARQILAKSANELVNAAKRVKALDDPGDELLADFRSKWVRHVAIQEQVSGMTAEAGRALQQFRMLADSRAVRGDVLSAMSRGGGGKDSLRDAASVLIDAVEESPGKFNAAAQKAMQPKWRNRVSEFYINVLLSNPATHMVNMVSNTMTAIGQIPEHATGALIGKARQVLPGANVDRVVGSEVGARAFGLLQGAKEGARLFARAIRTGEPSDFVSKVEGQEYKAIPGVAGEVIRTPTRLLTAEDELFKGIARRMELNGLAVRQAHKEGLRGDAATRRIAELIDDPTDAMLRAADEYGRYVTFQTRLGPTAQKVSAITGENLVAKVFMPFVRTPTNLLKYAVERSPAAPLLKEWKADFAAGGARRDLAIAKSMLGTGLGMAIYEGALAGNITGSAPPDDAKARLLYADGWQPYSIRLGDTWYSYKRLDPLATTLGFAADLATLPEGMSERQQDDKVTLLVASIMGNLASKTWLSGISDLVGALDDPGRNADRLVQRLVGSFAVPAGVAGAARAIDPVSRETDSVGEYLQSRIPFASQGLRPRLDVWGRPIVSEGGVGPDWLSPVYTSTARNDPVNRAMLALDYAPGKVGNKLGDMQLTPDQHSRYQQVAGQRSHAALQALVGSPQWSRLDTDARREAAEKAVRVARGEARSALFGGMASVTDGRIPPPPPGFRVEGEAAGRNVYRELQEAIPGVRFTSGYRSEAYQADMRRRGYKPAYNSGHLDGSALDMLPPPGKSMAWLKGQVGKLHPDARLLIHDGHLHATFPGYFGAPPLGGARKAGLRNPLEGMPPPPSGFVLDGQ